VTFQNEHANFQQFIIEKYNNNICKGKECSVRKDAVFQKTIEQDTRQIVIQYITMYFKVRHHWFEYAHLSKYVVQQEDMSQMNTRYVFSVQ